MWLCDKGNDTEVGMMGKCQDFYEVAEQTEPKIAGKHTKQIIIDEAATEPSTDCGWK